jgi:hypothetical protein
MMNMLALYMHTPVGWNSPEGLLEELVFVVGIPMNYSRLVRPTHLSCGCSGFDRAIILFASLNMSLEGPADIFDLLKRSLADLPVERWYTGTKGSLLHTGYV